MLVLPFDSALDDNIVGWNEKCGMRNEEGEMLIEK